MTSKQPNFFRIFKSFESIILGFEFIVLLMRRDRVLTSQLAKMKIQLGLLREKITNESKVRPIFSRFSAEISLENEVQKL